MFVTNYVTESEEDTTFQVKRSGVKKRKLKICVAIAACYLLHSFSSSSSSGSLKTWEEIRGLWFQSFGGPWGQVSFFQL